MHRDLGSRAKQLISLGVIGCLLGSSLLSHALAQAETEALRQSALFAQRKAMSCRDHMEEHAPLAHAALQPICPCGCSDPASPSATPSAPVGVGIPSARPSAFATACADPGGNFPDRFRDTAPRAIEHIPIPA